MVNVKLSSGLRLCLFLCVLFIAPGILGQQSRQTPQNAAFELKNGDRVVFVGNSLFENDLEFGYLELALATRWPDREVTFRNLGWTGDMVRGQARSQFTNPPDSWHLLLQQITNTHPTLVFIAYGGNEALEGDAGLAGFRQGLTMLIDTIENLGAEIILLSPIPVLSDDSTEELREKNNMIGKYGATIKELASARNKLFIDVFSPLRAYSRKNMLSDNAIHMNETGYYYLSSIIEKRLGLSPRHAAVTIRLSKTNAEASAPVKMINPGNGRGKLEFIIDEPCLPLPLPAGYPARAADENLLRIVGLKKGMYTLTNDQLQVVTASARQWEEGVPIRQGRSFNQASQLQTMIIKKNELFFQQYRPLNRTYILGFRSYEQGRHVKGLEDLGLIIKWLEGQIAFIRAPKPTVYQLTKVQ